jgi:hypothetical protein
VNHFHLAGRKILEVQGCSGNNLRASYSNLKTIRIMYTCTQHVYFSMYISVSSYTLFYFFTSYRIGHAADLRALVLEEIGSTDTLFNLSMEVCLIILWKEPVL